MLKHITTMIITGMLVMLCSVSVVWALTEVDLQKISMRYGVSPHLLRAIAIVESQEGKLTGTYEVRTVINETQLAYLEKIARHTGRTISDFTGSSAGAMGYMQIIPSTFYLYRQDGDGDGVKDPLNPHDSVATAAYFLARKMAQTDSLEATLRYYNNDAAYGKKVITLYRQLELERTVASRLRMMGQRLDAFFPFNSLTRN